MRPLIQQELLKHDMDYLVREGQKIGLPIGPVQTVAQAAEHPHLQARAPSSRSIIRSRAASSIRDRWCG